MLKSDKQNVIVENSFPFVLLYKIAKSPVTIPKMVAILCHSEFSLQRDILLSGGRVETPTFSNQSSQILTKCLVSKKKNRKLSSSMILRLVELSKPTRSEPHFRVTTEKVRKLIPPKWLFSLLFPVLHKRINHPLKLITRMGN